MPGANTWLYAPYQILALTNVRNTGTAQLPAKTFVTYKKNTPQNFPSLHTCYGVETLHVLRNALRLELFLLQFEFP